MPGFLSKLAKKTLRVKLVKTLHKKKIGLLIFVVIKRNIEKINTNRYV